VTPLAHRLAAPVLTLVTAGVGAFSTPAQASDAAGFVTTPSRGLLGSPVVYVEEHVGARFDSALRSSVAWVDRATGSTMRLGRCRPGYRCIRVIQSNATRGHGAYTSWTTGRKVSTIRLSSALGRKSWYARRAVIDHELGHANGAGHNARCTSRMWRFSTCRDGRIPPRAFTKAERAKLARW
jgi:hypothetical protein